MGATMSRIAKIRARAEAAEGALGTVEINWSATGCTSWPGAGPGKPDMAGLLCGARYDVPYLLARLERYERALKQYAERSDWMVGPDRNMDVWNGPTMDYYQAQPDKGRKYAQGFTVAERALEKEK